MVKLSLSVCPVVVVVVSETHIIRHILLRIDSPGVVACSDHAAYTHVEKCLHSNSHDG